MKHDPDLFIEEVGLLKALGSEPRQLILGAIERGVKNPGAIVQIVKKTGFIVATGSGHLLILEVQPEGKKRMGAYDFVIGHDVKVGETLPN